MLISISGTFTLDICMAFGELNVSPNARELGAVTVGNCNLGGSLSINLGLIAAFTIILDFSSSSIDKSVNPYFTLELGASLAGYTNLFIVLSL